MNRDSGDVQSPEARFFAHGISAMQVSKFHAKGLSTYHLVILSTDNGETSIRSLNNQISCQITSKRPSSPRDICDEGLCCLFFIAQITSTSNVTLYQELARAPDRKSAVTVSRIDNPEMTPDRKANVLRVRGWLHVRARGRSHRALTWAVTAKYVS